MVGLSGVSGLLMAMATVIGPVLVYFTSKRGQKDAKQQSVAAAKITENGQALTEWQGLAEHHRAERDHARAEEDKARATLEEERGKRRTTEDLLDTANGRIRALYEENLTLRGVVAGEVALTASVFPAIAPRSQPNEIDPPHVEGVGA